MVTIPQAWISDFGTPEPHTDEKPIRRLVPPRTSRRRAIEQIRPRYPRFLMTKFLMSRRGLQGPLRFGGRATSQGNRLSDRPTRSLVPITKHHLCRESDFGTPGGQPCSDRAIRSLVPLYHPSTTSCDKVFVPVLASPCDSFIRFQQHVVRQERSDLGTLKAADVRESVFKATGQQPRPIRGRGRPISRSSPHNYSDAGTPLVPVVHEHQAARAAGLPPSRNRRSASCVFQTRV